MSITILHGDCRDVLQTMPERSVQCVVTSPPYYALRAYGGGDREIGQETQPDCLAWARREPPCGGCYVCAMREVFAGLWRVLRDDGTVWLNLGDSYANTGRTENSVKYSGYQVSRAYDNGGAIQRVPPGLKPKDILGIPWRVALALQADGWYLRSDIVWSKPNCMPESVTDRPTRAHEYVFLLAKSARYFYDADAIREPNTDGTLERARYAAADYAQDKRRDAGDGGKTTWQKEIRANGRNRRTVWTISTQPYSGAHYATMPEALIEPCILAGSAAQACEHCGAAWGRVVERSRATFERVDDPTPFTGRKGMNRERPDTSDRYVLAIPQHEVARRLREAANGRSNEMRDRFGSKWDHWTRTDSSGARVPTFEDAAEIKMLLDVDIPFDGKPGGFAPRCTCPDNTGSARSVVLDPFAGSGTVLRVAARYQRDAIGIELNQEYIEQHVERRTNGLQIEMFT